MFIDSSALVAVMTKEADAIPLAEQMRNAETRVVSAAVVWEVVVNLAKKKNLSLQRAQTELK
ncbi:MAG: type II toxin-antitoxin system VapC family toxin, partial [Hoeflea sp.]|nr:type II toxin-antitoxin system VapC family toxin [Hoeflea sp.]